MRLTATHVAAARAMLKMSQEELAEAAGITPEALSNFERGKTIPYASTLAKLQLVLENRGIVFTNGDKPGVTLDRSKAIIPT